MKNITKIALLLILTFAFIGCKLKKDKDTDEVALHASCNIQDITLDNLECIEFYAAFTGDSEDLCDDAQDRNVASLKSHKDANSATTCAVYEKVGSCQKSNYTIFFYKDGYTAGQAQTECNSLSGTFSQ